MAKSKLLIILTLTLGLIILPILGACAAAETSQLKVVTSTSLLAYIVERVGDDSVVVVNIVPPSQHPGDFDAKPGDIRQLADADLFLLHGWPGEKYAQDLIVAADNPDLTVVKIEIKGNWMTPPVQLEATDKVVGALSQADSKNSAAYQKAGAEYKEKVIAKEAELKAKLAAVNPSAVTVMSAFWQGGFVRWTGLNLVATYGDPQPLTAQVVKELVDKGREARVALIIDNLHSGPDAGKAIAEELGCKRIVISNFPGGFDDTETWEKAIDRNVELILEALTR